ncbi:oxidoreductase [Paractinoplanes abujensis]|uniref:NAD(P)-dependent dehydrogenase (Short-subunit alcohol dehydrogenase family) n=1 Tax=Paractinoplanes abujensis TaxID=882441 RepID=A0A7W7CQY7_9ACTN|nr:SDR family NAD(P)-dependent oxidoreductase [Actinoplanes abujensis]MBB4691296.1 NAD(P)-dependent dehydrogenase (short-subunit alcohol dehydrogenase family) [Actinoplanes abujensis]GID17290.1 oxidoreductase [Actinoplanes abujensis]
MKQHPLGTGFTAAATADDVLAGRDLNGFHAIVTGGHSGIGLETTRALSRAGAAVTVVARNPGRAAAAVDGLARVTVDRLDLLDPASIDSFAARYLASGRPLHALINNAGLPAPRTLMRDARGYEAQFATNHLGHFQLTLRLHPALRATPGARVVNVTSGAQRFSDVLWDDPTFQHTPYDPMLAYAQSKTANVLHAVELDRRWSAGDVHGYAVHPGVVVGTGLNGAGGREQLRSMGLIDEHDNPIIDPSHGKKTPQQGASTSVFAATSPLLSDIGGVYLKDNDISVLDDRPRPMSAIEPPAEVVSHSIDPKSAERLWELSEAVLTVPS